MGRPGTTTNLKHRSTLMSPSTDFDFSKLHADGEYMLITCDNFFTHSDGQQYQAIWGLCRVRTAKTVLGFDPRSSTNWLMQIGDGKHALFIMGCRIHYAMICPDEPTGQNILRIRSAHPLAAFVAPLRLEPVAATLHPFVDGLIIHVQGRGAMEIGKFLVDHFKTQGRAPSITVNPILRGRPKIICFGPQKCGKTYTARLIYDHFIRQKTVKIIDCPIEDVRKNKRFLNSARKNADITVVCKQAAP